jgi:ABC-2 type transport system permease protein/oleandomycin transport system permease protein
MTAASIAISGRPRRGIWDRFALGVRDVITITKRNLLAWVRVPAILVFTLVQPIMFVLLFRYVFGGAIPVNTKGGYVNYLLPGVIGQTVAFASFTTATALSREIQRGSIDRFRSMPIARAAVLLGRLGADAIRMLMVMLTLIGVGYAVGFRFTNGWLPALWMVAMGEAFGLVTCLIAAYIGLAIKDEEATQAFGLIWLFPLTFVSAAFVQVASMPGWLQAFANNQPVTIVIKTMRSLALGGPVLLHAWQSVVWLVGLTVVFGPLAVRAYRRA